MLMPASCGVQGPGEMRMRSGCRASTSAGVSSSLRRIDHLRAQLAHVLDQVVGEGVVVVEDEDHRISLILRLFKRDLLAGGSVRGQKAGHEVPP